MCNCRGPLQNRADEISAWGMVIYATDAAKAHVAYSRALDSSRRAQVLIGDGAGQERAWAAQQYFRHRTASLKHLVGAVDDLRASAEPDRVSRADELIAQGSVTELLASARHRAVAALVESDISAGRAGEALVALDQRIEEIGSAASFGQLTELLTRYAEGHIARTYEEAAQDSALCEIILILSSLLAILAIIAALICVLTLGFACDGILDQLIAQACPS